MNNFKKDLLNITNYEENLKNYLKQLKQVKEIIIWGAIVEETPITQFLKKHNLFYKVIGYADNNSEKWGKILNNLKVLSPNEVLEKSILENNLYVIVNIMSKHKQKVKEQLIRMGIRENRIDIEGRPLTSIFVTTANRKHILEHSHIYEQVYSILEDEYSKEVYLAKLKYLLSGNDKYLTDFINDEKNQYFDDKLIKLLEDEVFVDCGSFSGDTLEKFYELTHGRYKKYIAIEADKKTYEELKKIIKNKDYQNIQIFNNACWNEKALLIFNAQQNVGSCIVESSSIVNNGNTIVEADSLDNFIKDEKVTFIKMDIEGAEENALRGAKKLIEKYKPILAICIYHKTEDHYKIPLLIKELDKEYKLYIRQYGEGGADTICYGIPKERCL